MTRSVEFELREGGTVQIVLAHIISLQTAMREHDTRYMLKYGTDMLEFVIPHELRANDFKMKVSLRIVQAYLSGDAT